MAAPRGGHASQQQQQQQQYAQPAARGSGSSAAPRKRKKPNNGRIPRPMNSFMCFAKEYRPKLQEANPGTDNKVISKELGRLWKGLSETERQRYIDESERLAEEHKRMYPDWKFTRDTTKNKKKKAQAEVSASVASSLSRNSHALAHGYGAPMAAHPVSQQSAPSQAYRAPFSSQPGQPHHQQRHHGAVAAAPHAQGLPAYARQQQQQQEEEAFFMTGLSDGKREQALQRLQRYGMEAAASVPTSYAEQRAAPPHFLPPPPYAEAHLMRDVGPEELKELHDVYRERQLNSYRQQQLRRQIMESQPPPEYVAPPLAAMGDSSRHSAEDSAANSESAEAHDGHDDVHGDEGEADDDGVSAVGHSPHAAHSPPSYTSPPHFEQASRLNSVGAH